MPLSDKQIVERAKEGMIKPFIEEQVSKGVISYGLSSYGYDIRLSNEWGVLDINKVQVIDPKELKLDDYVFIKSDEYYLEAGGFVLGRTVETFNIPRDIITICMGKSTLARAGVSIDVTPFEPEWKGEAVIEITNNQNVPVILRANEGIGQLIFLRGDELCSVSYDDRKHKKYQNQKGVTISKVVK